MTVASVPLRSGALLVHGDADVDAVGDARRDVEAWLEGHDVSEDVTCAVALVTSELVTNAVRHGRSGFVLTVDAVPDGITVRVADTGPGVPAPIDAGTDELHGRGLALVAHVCDAGGWGPLASGGKVVWAHVPRT